MKSEFYWDSERWGSDCPPENWRDICDAANNKINEYISENELDANEDFEQISDFSQLLAENWLTLDLLPDELR